MPHSPSPVAKVAHPDNIARTSPANRTSRASDATLRLAFDVIEAK